MKIIIFHLWLSPLVKYIFSYHSIKINLVFIEKLEYPLYINHILISYYNFLFPCDRKRVTDNTEHGGGCVLFTMYQTEWNRQENCARAHWIYRIWYVECGNTFITYNFITDNKLEVYMVDRVVFFISLVPHHCEKTVRLAYETSVVLLRCLLVPEIIYRGASKVLLHL